MTKRDVLSALAELYPWMGPYYCRPVREYAHFLYAFEKPHIRCEIRIRSFDKLLAMFRRAGVRSGLSADEISRICEEFTAIPVLQTGPHLMLVTDVEAFYTHLFSLMGLSSHGASSYVSYAVSTVNLVEKGRRGPGWVNVDGQAVSLFGLSRNQMLPLSLLAGPGRYRFEIDNASADCQALEILRRQLPGGYFDRPAHALKSANRALWSALFGSQFRFLQIDDEDVADLICDHLADEGSWLRERFFERPAAAAKVIEEMDKLSHTGWEGWLPRGTDFFWLYENGRRCALRLVEERLVEPNSGKIAAKFDPAELCRQLEERRLIPSLLLVFLVLAILPGVRVLGGSRHPVYYPLMRHIIIASCRSTKWGGELQQQLARDERPSGWGHRVIESSENPLQWLTAHAPISERLKALSETDLDVSCGELSSFATDALWQEFVSRLRSKAMSSRDLKWTFS